MKVIQLVLIGALGVGTAASASAQQPMYGYPTGGPYGGAQRAGYMQPMGPQMGYPQEGYQQAAPGGYPMAGEQIDPQQALYGPATPMNGDPPSMYGDGGGMSCGGMQCGGNQYGGMPCGDCGCGPNQARCYDDGTTHYAYASVEVFYARRDNAAINQPVILDSPPGGPVTTLASATDISFIYMPGIKAQAGYFFSNGWGVESDFWGQWSFDRFVSESQASPGTLAVPDSLGTLPNFFNQDQITESYSSHINNYEINVILPYASMQYLVGFRYLAIDERFNVATSSAATGTGDYLITARNRMYGGQLGLRNQWQIERFVFDFEGKAGVFVNAAHQDQSAVDNDGNVLFSGSGGEHQTAFVGEVSAYLFIPLGTHFTGRLGYTAIWVDDLALAPDQLDFANANSTTAGTGIYARGSMLIHGFNAGIEARW